MYICNISSHSNRYRHVILIHFHQGKIPPHQPSIILTQPQPLEIRHRTRAVEIPIPRLRRQDAGRHAGLPIPLRRRLGRPGPVEPAPGGLEAGHLRLGVHQEPGLVGVGIGGRVGVGGGAGAGGGFGGAVGGEDGDGAVGGVQRPFPAGAGVDVVEVGGAVRVGLGPFAAERGAEAVTTVSEFLSYPVYRE